jgi:hemolysin III
MTEKIRFTKKEEIANAVSHLIGGLLAISALVLMVVFSVMKGNAWHVVSTSIFGAGLIILYFSSTFTHWLKPGNVKEFFFTLDQIAIFFLIAATYTPLSLVALHGAFGWTIFGIEWGLALLGITIKLLKPTTYSSGVNLFYISLYAIMGWLVVIAVVPLMKILPVAGFIWIILGGLFYTTGIWFYKKANFRYHHLVWHLLVMAGSISHFFAIFFYVIPLSIN